MKLLKCSDEDQVLNYNLLYPKTQKDINELRFMPGRNRISITTYKSDNVTCGQVIKYNSGKELIVG